ncbi:MAG: glycoside hydrolase family 2 TIM barrel-domain containing protein [Acidobacteriota bacterium]
MAELNFMNSEKLLRIGTLAAALVSTGWLTIAATAQPASSLSLNGEWTFSIQGQGHKKMNVPSTYLPVGGATLEREFTMPVLPNGGRALLRFDGIVMTAEVFINGTSVGQYGPYTPFTIDITNHLRSGVNHLLVNLTDLGGFAPWGREWVTAFPRYGGIIRDVTLEFKPAVYIEKARLDYDFSSDYRRATCRLNVWLVNTLDRVERLELSASLEPAEPRRPFGLDVRPTPGRSQHTLRFGLDPVRLWSPESPELYNLTVRLTRAGEEWDRFQSLTGFKDFVARGRHFYLNGRKFFLKGIFRHDIYGGQGHTLTRAQMESEIADIKSLGCNFLRLGHYPQHAYITELAARYGLLTSGEPPVFGLDQNNANVVEGAKFCLRGLIERDWNNPAAAFWIIANESGTHLAYMKEVASFVRSLDPRRLVTIVDNTKWNGQNVPWRDFRLAGIDFICQNAYGAAFDGSYEKLDKLLPDDLPFVISEWGGTSNVYSSVLREGRYYFERSCLVRETGPCIAGISFWEYQDIPLSRWTEEGLLHWALVDVDRRPYETYYALKSLYTGRKVLPPRGRLLVPNMEEELPRPLAGERMERFAGYEVLDVSGIVNSRRIISELNLESPLAYPEQLPLGNVAVAGLPFRLENQLVALSRRTPSVRIPVGHAASELLFLGHVCFNSLAKAPSASPPELPYLSEVYPGIETPAPLKGYPQAGAFGETVGQYTLVYEDEEQESIPLQNGIHFADYRLFYGFSRIDAVATATERVLSYKGDHGAKAYQMRLFSYRPKRPGTPIQELRFSLKNFDYVPLLAGITSRRYEPE